MREVEAKWAGLRAGRRGLTEREAHEFARDVHDDWLRQHRDDPTFRTLRHTDRYDELWTAPGAESGQPDTIPITAYFYSGMRGACFRAADRISEARGLLLDEWGRFTLAEAAGAALQRASLVLRDEAKGIGHGRADTGATPIPAPISPASPPGQPFTFETLLAEWERERQPRPRTVYERTNMVRKLQAHPGFDDVRRLTPERLIGGGRRSGRAAQPP